MQNRKCDPLLKTENRKKDLIEKPYLVVSLLVQFDSWETIDFSVFQFIDGGINLGYDNRVVFLKLLFQLYK